VILPEFGSEEAARVITSTLKRMQPNRPHLAVLVVLLLGSLLLTIFLAYQGFDATKNQRLQAEMTLRDWAQLAAVKWDERVQPFLYNSIYHAFLPALAADGSTTVDPEFLERRTRLQRLCECFTSSDARTFFTYDFATGELATTRAPLSPAVRGWVAGQLTDGEGEARGDGWQVGSMIGTPDGEQHVVFYTIKLTRGNEPFMAYGLDISANALAKYFDSVWRMEPLLPRPVGKGMPNDWMLSVRVTDAQGREWYQSAGRYPRIYTSTHAMNAIIRGLDVTVSVRPEAAQTLLIGGFPTSRLPTMFVLLALTAGLLIVAIFLIRREADITRLRSDFIAGVSHELRTPLSQIRMFAETLMLGRVRTEVERQRSLEIIDQEARRLTHLVENVLLFARAERRSGRINPERIDLAADVRDAVHGFAILCRSKAIEIRPELQEGITAPVDRGALRQILLNLLDNAAKYGPLAQRITVGLALFDQSARLWVDDEGQGIPEADRAHVFESFFRLDRDIASAVAGSGIGLSIVRELVLLHQGRVWIEDAPGGGARVVVEFPGAYLRADVAKDEWAVA
jgi:signal transduction histidine kinase